MKQAMTVNEPELIALCPCGEVNYLPNVSERPMLRFDQQVWYPKLVAVRCTGCKDELRLD